MDARLLFLLGALGYMCLELIWRGRTHWSMGLAGGTCVVLLYGVYTHVRMSMFAAFLCAALLVSAVEFLFGFVFNLVLRNGVWDYSSWRFNLYGQVCLPYSLLWGGLGALFYSIL